MGFLKALLSAGTIKALFLDGLTGELNHLFATIKPEHLKAEVEHYLKGRFGIDPAIVHPNPILGIVHLGKPEEKAAACAKLDAEIDSLFAHNTPDQLVPAIVKLVEGEVAHLFHV